MAAEEKELWDDVMSLLQSHELYRRHESYLVGMIECPASCPTLWTSTISAVLRTWE